MDSHQIKEQLKEQTKELSAQISAMFGKTVSQSSTKVVVSTFDYVDANSLFTVVQEVLNNTIVLAEKHFKPGKPEQVVKTGSNRSLNSNCPLSLLKRITCKVGCSEDTKEAFKLLSDMLSKYSLAQQAVLTLAAFAMVYGDLIFYVDSRGRDGFTSSLSSLRQVDVLIGHRQDQNVLQAFGDLNTLTKISLEIIDRILKLSNPEFDSKDPASVKVKNILITGSTVVIQSAIACLVQVDHLSDHGVPKLELIGLIRDLEKLRADLVEFDEYLILRKIDFLIKNPSGITQLIATLIYSSDDQQCLYDYQLKKQVDIIEVLKKKNVLLFISNLYISKDDLWALEDVLKDHDDYKIVWIPIVEQWDTKKISEVSLKLKCYTVYYKTQIIGIKYIKQVWGFSYNPKVVVFNPEGRIVCNDAMQMIRLWRWKAFPFNLERPRDLFSENQDCLSLFFSYYKEIKLQVEKGSYILFYGGYKDEWINTFKSQVEIKVKQFATKVQISAFAIQEKRGKNDLDLEAGQFWSIIESFYYLGIQWNHLDATTITEIQKLLSYKKYEKGWALLYRKGSSLISGPGASILQAVEEYLKNEKPSPGKPFEIGLSEYISQPLDICCHIEIQSSSEWLPMELKCPFCSAMLKRVVAYKCCHESARENKST